MEIKRGNVVIGIAQVDIQDNDVVRGGGPGVLVSP